MHHRIRRADQPRDARRRWAFGLFRYGIYGTVGVAAEVHFYTLIKIAKHLPWVERFFAFTWRVDPKLELEHVWDTPVLTAFGQSSFWMFLVYATCAFCSWSRSTGGSFASPCSSAQSPTG